MADMWIDVSDEGGDNAHLINLNNADGIILDKTLIEGKPFVKIYKIDSSSGRRVPLFFEIFESEEEAKRVYETIIDKL